MNRWTRLAPLLLIAAALAGCGSPNGGNPLSPNAPRRDNGLGMGGSATGCPDTGTPPPCGQPGGPGSTSTNSTGSANEEPALTPPDSTERGGLGMGGS
jgi:hypothetical protein